MLCDDEQLDEALKARVGIEEVIHLLKAGGALQESSGEEPYEISMAIQEPIYWRYLPYKG